MRRTRGFSALELLVVLAVGGMLVMVGTPPIRRWHSRTALAHAGLSLLADVKQCQTLAAQHMAPVGLVFDVDQQGSFYVMVKDGNGNGVSRKDYLAGRDPVLRRAKYFSSLGAGVRLGLAPRARIPQPGGGGFVPESGLALGRAGILSFTPSLGASPGSVYLSAGGEVVSLRVTPLGVARLFRWNAQRQSWQTFSF